MDKQETKYRHNPLFYYLKSHELGRRYDQTFLLRKILQFNYNPSNKENSKLKKKLWVELEKILVELRQCFLSKQITIEQLNERIYSIVIKWREEYTQLFIQHTDKVVPIRVGMVFKTQDILCRCVCAVSSGKYLDTPTKQKEEIAKFVKATYDKRSGWHITEVLQEFLVLESELYV